MNKHFFIFKKFDLKIKDFVKIVDGFPFSTDDYSSYGKYKIITIANITGDRYMRNLEEAKSICNIPTKLNYDQMIRNGDLLITMTGNVGRTSFSNSNDCLLNQRVCKILARNPFYTELIYQLTKTSKFQNAMEIESAGAAQKNISKAAIYNFKFDSSSLNKINIQILKMIDSKIEILKSLESKEKALKQFLLENLFI